VQATSGPLIHINHCSRHTFKASAGDNQQAAASAAGRAEQNREYLQLHVCFQFARHSLSVCEHVSLFRIVVIAAKQPLAFVSSKWAGLTHCVN
jgi:hypothetical protein